MSEPRLHQCECPECRRPGPSPTRDYHAQVNLFLATLTEPQRRLFAGMEARRLGEGGANQLALISGLSPATIAQGERELEQAQAIARTPAFDLERYLAKKALLAEDLLGPKHRKFRPPPRQFKCGAD
jgi:hypothetical protein